MKRDNELIKKILINVENDEANAVIDGYDKQEVLNHKAYLIEEEYLEGQIVRDTESKIPTIGQVSISKLEKKGHDYIMNDGEESSIIEKTEINNINIHGDNHGIISAGNKNMISTEFNQKFSQLIEAIQVSNIENKNQIIRDLNTHKEDKVALQEHLGRLLTRSAEIATLAPIIGALLGMLGIT